jgi:hypothetical protein
MSGKIRSSNGNRSKWLNPGGLVAPKVFNLPTAKLYKVNEDELREIMPIGISEFFDAIDYDPNSLEESGRYIGKEDDLDDRDFYGTLVNRRRAF